MRYQGYLEKSEQSKRGSDNQRNAGQGSLRKGLAGAAASAVLLMGINWAGAAGAVSTPDSFFPIGVWSQPAYTFDKWQSRGINTVINYEPYGGQDSIDVWSNAANAHNFYQVRQPRANPADDLKETRLLAWMHLDEPDLHKTSPSLLAADYAKWKAVDPSKPVFINFSGGELLNHSTSNTTYQQYMASADIIGNDFYPVTGWGRPDWIDNSRTAADRKTEGMAIKGYSDLSGGKPQWAFIETSAQKLSWIQGGNARGVTPAEFRGEVWDAIINGAKGVAYFPQQIGSGFRFDMTPADVVSEMTTQNSRIQSLARVLNASSNPTADKIAMASSLLEGARKTYDGDQYFFILNMSGKALTDQAVALPGLSGLSRVDVFGEGRDLGFANGQLVDQFDPWEMHVYHADLAGFGILPASGEELGAAPEVPEVPEPGTLSLLAIGVVGFGMRRRR
jgi:hypothetical protein